MSLPRDTVGESIMFLGCPVRLSSQILSLRYIMNGLNNLDETDGWLDAEGQGHSLVQVCGVKGSSLKSIF